MNEIKVERKNIYGREMVYPVCEKAKIFASLARRKTLKTTEIAKIKLLGYTVTVVQTGKETL